MSEQSKNSQPFWSDHFTVDPTLPATAMIVSTGKETKVFRFPAPDEAERSAALESALQAWRMKE